MSAINAISATATISDCGLYRYELTRTWTSTVAPVLFCMLNPSKADAVIDDPTIRKCTGFARAWGAGGIRVVNLFAYRATDPKELRAAHRRGIDIMGPANLATIGAAAPKSARVVLAWGANAESFREHAAAVTSLLRDVVPEAHCLGVSRFGFPLHPLMLPYSTPLVRFSAPGAVT